MRSVYAMNARTLRGVGHRGDDADMPWSWEVVTCGYPNVELLMRARVKEFMIHSESES